MTEATFPQCILHLRIQYNLHTVIQTPVTLVHLPVGNRRAIQKLAVWLAWLTQRGKDSVCNKVKGLKLVPEGWPLTPTCVRECVCVLVHGRGQGGRERE